MDFQTPRRRFLQVAGTGAALSVAGCNALQGDEPAAQDGSGDGETRSVGVAVEPDQEELQQRQNELREELQAGNISQQEAQQQAQEIEQELLSTAVETFQGRVDENDALSVEDSLEQFGLFLVDGDAVAIIDTLDFEEVGGIVAASAFEQAAAQFEGNG